MKRRMYLFCALLLAPALLPGQETAIYPPPDFVPPDVELKAYLGLTDAQVQSLREIQKRRSDEEQAIYRQINEKQVALNRLLESGSRDALQIGQLMVDIQALRSQIPVGGGPYRDSALAVLTPDQKTKLANLANALVLQAPAWQAVNWYLLDAPKVSPAPPRILVGVPAVDRAGTATMPARRMME